MLAYVFWHRPKADVNAVEYEAAQLAFHESLEIASACFRLDRLPFSSDEGYEDWYLVGDWNGLGRLNEVAVDAVHRGVHDRAAAPVADGWGAVYSLERGPVEIPVGTEWRDKPRGEPTTEFLDRLATATVWRRQLVLGPAPEFCLAVPPSAGRESIGLL